MSLHIGTNNIVGGSIKIHTSHFTDLLVLLSLFNNFDNKKMSNIKFKLLAFLVSSWNINIGAFD